MYQLNGLDTAAIAILVAVVLVLLLLLFVVPPVVTGIVSSRYVVNGRKARGAGVGLVAGLAAFGFTGVSYFTGMLFGGMWVSMLVNLLGLPGYVDALVVPALSIAVASLVTWYYCYWRPTYRRP